MTKTEMAQIIKNNFTISDEQISQVVKVLAKEYDIESENDVIELADDVILSLKIV